MVAEKMDRQDGGERYRADEDWFTTEVGDAETIAEAVVRSVAAVSGDDPMSMEPLGTLLDSDALNALFERPTGDSRLSFTFNGCDVSVYGGGTVCVRPRDE